MKKSLIGLGVLAASGAAMAQSSVTLYGVADLAIVKEKGSSTSLASGGVSTSRWGVKGSEDLGGGLSANFLFEQGIDLTSGAMKGNGFDRQTYLGLSGSFGEFKMGRMWNAYDDIAGASSPLFDAVYLTTNNAAASYALYNGHPVQGLYYATPAMGGFSATVSTSFKADQEILGDAYEDVRVSAFNVKYEGGPMMVALGYQQEKPTGYTALKFTRLVGSYDLGVAKLLGSYGVVKDASKDYTIGVDVPLSSALTLSAGWTQTKIDDSDEKIGTTGLAVAYSLSKRTTLYTGFNKDSKDAGDGNRFAFGVKHTF